MRGFACLAMFQTHCYDSWLGGAARESHFFKLSQLGGTLPAPLFLFIAGISFALITDRMRRKGIAANQIARTTILRGAEIFGLGLLFRVQEFALGQPWAPWTDLLRVDILNAIGISIMLMGVACRLARTRAGGAAIATVTAGAIALMTPPLWTTWRPDWLPWYLESYINGVHTLNAPQPWLFPIFPWTAFAFAGLATGFLLVSDWGKASGGRTTALCSAAGAALFFIALGLDALPVRVYAVQDFWHTSPNFFLARVGVLLMIVGASYAWCRWGPSRWIFSPLVRIGQTSLLVYWVHIEFVYGRFSILQKQAQTTRMASLGLLAIFVAMVLLSVGRARTKGRAAEIVAWFRRASGWATES